MEFRTKVTDYPSGIRIGYGDRGLLLGSCFAENVAARMKRARMRVAANPFGVLFNPESVAGAIEIMASGRAYGREDLAHCNGLWCGFDFHGSFSSPDPEEALRRMNESVKLGGEALQGADYVIITFGTAWAYELSADIQGGRAGKVVANCHKFPAAAFSRRRLGVEEIVGRYEKLMEGPLKGKRVTLTVSPVRHIKDGLHENNVSKATLMLAAGELCDKHPNISYFPAFEIVNDELRDYRFYAADMVHPSEVAVDYIWEKFRTHMLDPLANEAAREIEKLAAAMEHRPLNPGTPEHGLFRAGMRRKAEELEGKYPGVDLGAEKAFFGE